MFGGRSNRPASKATVLFAGAWIAGISGLLSVAVLFGERAPDAPLWAIAVAPIITLGGLACGIYILITGIRMP
jgi:hypothetical protein